jgi:Ca-activated chloride channel homolog
MFALKLNMKHFKIKNLILLTFLSLTLASFCKAQDDEPPIKVNTYLVNIPVIASDREGRNISGLTKENFSIFQDGVEQEIAFFAGEEAPMNVVILIDTSFSTKSVIGEIKKAAREFINVLCAEDQAMIVSFDYKTRILSSFTSDHKELFKAINKARIDHGLSSNMQDAMHQLVTKEFAQVKGRKAIIVLTDGDVKGEISDQKLLNILSESDVLVYPVITKDEKLFSEIPLPGYLILPSGQKTRSKKEMRKILNDHFKERELFMNVIADTTGGRLYPSDSKDFKQIFQKIADELKKQYLIGFYPQEVEAGKQTEIKVDVNPDDIVIRTKRRIRLRLL